MNEELSAERPAHVAADRFLDFDIYAPPGVKDDFHVAMKALQAPGVPDLVWTPRNGGHWIATRNAMIRVIMSDYERFTSRHTILPKSAGENVKMLPLALDPPAHRPYRMLLNNGLSPKAVGRIENKIRAIAITLIEAVQLEGRCSFTADFAELFPIQVFLGMCDLPLADAPMLTEWTSEMLRPTPGRDWSPDKNHMDWGFRHLFAYLEPYIEERRRKPGDDLLSQMFNGQVDGRALSSEEALQLSSTVLVAGLDTVVNFLGFVMLHLARNVEARRELVANPALIPDAVEELLRRYPISMNGREVAYDMEFAGVQMKKGEMISAPTPLAGIDERANDHSMTVDFHRRGGEHTTFGAGSHVCAGARLARTEIRITLEEWLKRIPEFEIAPGEEVHFTGGIVGVVDAVPLVWKTNEQTLKGLTDLRASSVKQSDDGQFSSRDSG
jgi:cytochrome P450